MPFSLLLLAVPFLVARAGARGPTPLLGTALVRTSPIPHHPPHYKVREIVIQAEPDRTCPSGFEQSGGNCLQVESLPALKQCPPGWQYSDDGDFCIGYSAVDPEHSCDAGQPGFESCIRQRSVPKVLVCPEGFILKKNLKECVRDIPHAPLEVCPPGVRYAHGSCITVRTEMPHTRCPHDFQLVDGSCQKIIQQPILRVCPPGYNANGKKGECERPIVQQPSRRCPVGFELRGGDCVAEHHAPPTFVCQKGKMVEGNMCVLTHSAVPQIACSKGMQLNPLSGMCERDDVRPPLAECTKGTLYNPITNQCGSANKLKQPNLACPPNYRFVGKTSCVQHQQEAPQKVCPPGFDLIGKEECRRQETILPQGRCPSGSQLIGKFCVAVTTAPFEYICDKGSVLSGKQCLSKATAQPSVQCPPQMTLSADGSLCLSSQIQTPTVACPPNTSQRADANGLLCMVASETPATRSCPPHMQMLGNECMERIVSQPSSACPPQFFEDLRTGRCFASDEAPQRAFCPVGYKLVGNRCLKREQTPLVPLCPPGYTATNGSGDSSICARETVVPFLELCTFGFQLENGVCIAKKLQYEFDEHEPEERPQEQLKDMDSPIPTQAPAASEPDIEVKIDRPIVQKGLVMRNEPIILSGPASEVARKQAILAAGGDIADLGADVQVEYAPAHPAARNNANIGALLATMANH